MNTNNLKKMESGHCKSGIMADNKASICLHETCGFRQVGYRDRMGKDRFGQWRNTVLMDRINNLN